MKLPIYKIGQEITVPSGETGIYVEQTPIGELRIVCERREYYLFPEDIEEQKEANENSR